MAQHSKPTDADWLKYFDQRDTVETALIKCMAYLLDLRSEVSRLTLRVADMERLTRRVAKSTDTPAR